VSATGQRTCTLAAQAGRVEVCTEDCPLWEYGRCQLEAVLDPEADLEHEPDDSADPS
jgi:hypothetical protein